MTLRIRCSRAASLRFGRTVQLRFERGSVNLDVTCAWVRGFGQSKNSAVHAFGPHRVTVAVAIHDTNAIASFGEEDKTGVR
jgi:hypothetical protein